jgi:hypothetical protein
LKRYYGERTGRVPDLSEPLYGSASTTKPQQQVGGHRTVTRRAQIALADCANNNPSRPQCCTNVPSCDQLLATVLVVSWLACGPAPKAHRATPPGGDGGGEETDAARERDGHGGADAHTDGRPDGKEVATDAADPAVDGSTVKDAAIVAPSSIEVQEDSDTVTISNGRLHIAISKKSGLADYGWGSTVAIRGAFSSARLGVDVRAQDASSHLVAPATPFQDALGNGLRITASHTAPGKPTLRQSYEVYEQLPFFLIQEEVADTQPVSSNHLGALVVDASGAVDIGPAADARVLVVPFDNDEFVRYDARSLNSTGLSQEVTAIYDNQRRAGLILGSVTHDLWKTGISYRGAGGRIVTLELYGGASSPATHDTVPHGAVSGTSIRSPRMFVGYFDDWRTGMEAFGKANGALSPPPPWSDGVPFGFNTWAAYRLNPTPTIFRGVSDFLATVLEPRGFKGQGATFVNWDSGWDSFPATELAAAAAYARKNGQRAGIYFTPFNYWGDSVDNRNPDNEGYSWREMILKDEKGALLPKSDGSYPLDPTHPGTKARVRAQMQRFRDWGYEYVKLDFMTHAAREGVHFDPGVTTGIQAYNQGLDLLAAQAGGSMFLSLSIAPIFPGGHYAHARRVSCDVFGAIGDSSYLVNSSGLGWWLNGAVYRYNDPDHVVLGGHSLEEARTAVNAAAIAGTIFLDSDQLDSDAEAQARASSLLTNSDINNLVRRGQAFRPVEGNTGDQPGTVFVSAGGEPHLAVFNFSGTSPVTRSIDLSRAGLDGAVIYSARDLWSGARVTAKGTLPVRLDAGASTIFELTAAP